MTLPHHTTLSVALSTASDYPQASWVYLPAHAEWTLDCLCLIAEELEVAREEEDLPNAGVPRRALDLGLRQALPLSVFQDVIENARAQKHDATLEELLRALLFYWDRDAFIELT